VKNYHYDEFGVFTGETDARLDPLETERANAPVYIQVPSSTHIVPPNTGENLVPVFVDGTWVTLPDYRGETVYDVNYRSESIVENVGEIPKRYTKVEPHLFDEWIDNHWVRNVAKELADVRTKKLAMINQLVSNKIIGGFESSALGSVHRYSSDREDQLNISGSVQLSQLGHSPFHYCYDAQSVRKKLSHTPEQMIQVGLDFAAFKMKWLDKGTLEKERLLTMSNVADTEAFEISL